MERRRASFSQIKDTRHGSYVEYNLGDVLILIMGSVVSGTTELADRKNNDSRGDALSKRYLC